MDEREMPRVPLDQSYEDWFHDALSKGLVSARSDEDMQLAWQAARRTTPDRVAIIEECAKVCDEYAADQWSLYKGRAPYNGSEPGRADPDVQGRSDGADVCAERIRALKTAPTSDKGGATIKLAHYDAFDDAEKAVQKDVEVLRKLLKGD